jgi:hypothetical protein
MTPSTGWGWGLVLGGGLLALYGLHRLAMWLEARGHLYYSRRTPRGGGAMGSFVAIQEVLEPQTRHVIEIREEKRGESEEGVPGAGAWPAGRSPWATRDEPPA